MSPWGPGVSVQPALPEHWAGAGPILADTAELPPTGRNLETYSSIWPSSVRGRWEWAGVGGLQSISASVVVQRGQVPRSSSLKQAEPLSCSLVSQQLWPTLHPCPLTTPLFPVHGLAAASSSHYVL